MESILIQKVSVKAHIEVFMGLWKDHVQYVSNLRSSGNWVGEVSKTFIYTLGRQTGHTTIAKHIFRTEDDILVVLDNNDKVKEFLQGSQQSTYNLEKNVVSIQTLQKVVGLRWKHIVIDEVRLDKITKSEPLQMLFSQAETITILGGFITPQRK